LLLIFRIGCEVRASDNRFTNKYNELSISYKKKQAAHNIKLVYTFKNKKAEKLGDVYIEDYKNAIFKKLFITKTKVGKVDTLYFYK
jgi:hypothetical protein